MRIDIITAFPELIKSPLEHSIIKRAISSNLVTINLHDIRAYSINKHKKIDDYPYGGGGGMVMSITPMAKCIRTLQKEVDYDEVIFVTPDAKEFSQPMANVLSLKKNLLIIAGHYKGVDQRIRDLFVTQEISIGSYVLTGGELPALIITDAIVRLIPGIVGDEQSVLSDSFQDHLLAPPIYTRPQNFEGHKVPNVLVSGDDKKISAWRLEQSYEKTKKIRPNLLNNNNCF